MLSLTLLAILAVVLACSWLFTQLIIAQAARWGLQDIPNHRSSHTLPTPRGGGAAIVIASTLGLLALLLVLWLQMPSAAQLDEAMMALEAGRARETLSRSDVRIGWLFDHLSGSLLMGAPAVAGAVMMAVTGMVDDIKPQRVLTRLGIQMLAVALLMATLYTLAGGKAAFWQSLEALWAVLPLPGTMTQALADGSLLPALLATTVGLMMLAAGVWWINLFNFMDGIDGIAASQAIFMLLAGCLIRLLMTDTPAGFSGIADAIEHLLIMQPHTVASLIIAAAAAGFLLLNWAPARIFMGDAGSLFLGYTILTIAATDIAHGLVMKAQLGAAWDGPNPWLGFWSWLILGALFITDATMTLLRRLARGENVGSPHRSHAYQRLSRHYGHHGRATLVYCLINLFWLLPAALLAVQYPDEAALIAGVAYLPPVILAWRLGAGRREEPASRS